MESKLFNMFWANAKSEGVYEEVDRQCCELSGKNKAMTASEIVKLWANQNDKEDWFDKPLDLEKKC